MTELTGALRALSWVEIGIVFWHAWPTCRQAVVIDAVAVVVFPVTDLVYGLDASNASQNPLATINVTGSALTNVTSADNVDAGIGEVTLVDASVAVVIYPVANFRARAFGALTLPSLNTAANQEPGVARRCELVRAAAIVGAGCTRRRRPGQIPEGTRGSR